MSLVPKRGHARMSSISFAAIIVVAWQAQALGLGCCFPDGSCTDTFGGACSHAGGTPVPSCTPEACLGACCSGDTCTLTAADSCAVNEFHGIGSTCEPVLVGDVNCDGSLLSEWGLRWLDCLAGPGQPIIDANCRAVDLDADEDVDLGDVTLFGLVLGYRACSDVPFPCCGNGVVEAAEQCDDGNTTPGDGCDAACRMECTPGTVGCGWQDGDMVTYNQENWGTLSRPASTLLANNFPAVYPNGVEIGIPGAAGNSALWTTVKAVLVYLPTNGSPAPLDNDLLDPTSTSSGVFGGHLIALQIDVAFNDAGQILGSAPLQFGDLSVCGLTDTPSLNGLTVRQVLDLMNTAIGGGAAPYSYELLSTLAEELTQSFESGTVSQFAQEHLLNGACPCTPGAPGCSWQVGDVVTYTQIGWGDPTSVAGDLLNNQFSFVYKDSGVLEAGLAGTAGFSMLFTSSGTVLAFEPAIGNIGPLNADLIDPTSTSSGAFGGEVVALNLNSDFAAAGHTLGSSGLVFGNLTMCGFPANPALNGITVMDFRAMVNSALGGGPAPYPIGELHLIGEQVNAAFNNGNPSLFAQDHLFNGLCPCPPGTSGCGWEDGDILTYGHADWGDATTTAGVLLSNRFNTLYGSVGYVEVGIPGSGGFSMLVTSASAAFTYLPAFGAPAPLNADLVDATATASGVFGGEVLVLRFNIDLSDTNFLSGTTDIDIGNLTLCGLAQTGLNGTTVRAFQNIVNTALGGGSTPYAIADLTAIAGNISAAFSNGLVSVFAQDHLLNGPCP